MADKVSIKWVEETDSTQDEVRRHISEYDNLSVVAAEFQTAGRGQRGNRWLAGRGENLTFSFPVKFGGDGFPPLLASRQFLITQAVTVGVASYLEHKGISCSIKWPNDIYVRDKKICGMLIENSLDGNFLSRSIVGIGLNVNQKVFPPQLVNPVSMGLLTGEPYDTRAELGLLMERLVASLAFLSGGKDLSVLDSEYERRLYRKNVFHEYTICADGSHIEAKIVGVSPSGRLRTENRKGELMEFAFKEISYII